MLAKIFLYVIYGIILPKKLADILDSYFDKCPILNAVEPVKINYLCS